ncbi:MAG: hypothetical protein RR051_02195 [Clostridiales bacterium]
MSQLRHAEQQNLDILFPQLTIGIAGDCFYSPQRCDELVQKLKAGDIPMDRQAMADFAVDMSIACLWFYVVEYFATDLFSNRFTAAVEILRAAVYAAEEEEKVKDLAQELVKEMQNWESSLSQDETRRIYRAAEDTWQ